MARFSGRDSRRSGTCGRRECPSNASPGISSGRTRLFGSSSPTTAARGRRLDERSELRLSLEEREEISRGLAGGLSIRAIAAGLERSPSTVCREVNANGGRTKYRALQADRGAERRALRPKRAKLVPVPSAAGDRGTQARGPVVARSRSRRGWLRPIPITRRCRCPTRPSTSRSSSRAEAHYDKSCIRACGRGRAMRRAKAYTKGGIGQGQLTNMVMISERPAEVADRAVPGHWEGDLIFGRKMTSIGTLVERHSRYVILLKLPNGHGAEAVRKAMTKRILTLPAQLRRSITWDQGKEMAEHVQFTVDTGVQVYFCDPKSPWQRGSNENTNGLLRQYLPKSSDLSQCTQRELDAIARSLNTTASTDARLDDTIKGVRRRRCVDRLRTQHLRDSSGSQRRPAR